MNMPQISGLEGEQRLLKMSNSHPVIFMTGLRDVPITIQALKNGAVDFLLKPFTSEVLCSAVARAIERSIANESARRSVDEARARLDELTPRERQVCRLVADGMTSKEIATELGMAESTVSLHRAHILTKLDAKSVAEIVRLVDLAKSPEEDEPS